MAVKEYVFFLVKESIMISHMAALRHARWFEENASNPTIKVSKVIEMLY